MANESGSVGEGDFAEPGRLALPGTRLAAWFLDEALAIPFMFPGLVIGYRLGLARGLGRQVPGTLVFAAALSVVCMLALTGYQIYLESTKGQSLGKRWMKIRIAALDGSNAGFVRAILLRRVIVLMLYLVAWRCVSQPFAYAFLLANFVLILAPGRRCLHDRIAGTKVVAAESPAVTASV